MKRRNFIKSLCAFAVVPVGAIKAKKKDLTGEQWDAAHKAMCECKQEILYYGTSYSIFATGTFHKEKDSNGNVIEICDTIDEVSSLVINNPGQKVSKK